MCNIIHSCQGHVNNRVKRLHKSHHNPCFLTDAETSLKIEHVQIMPKKQVCILQENRKEIVRKLDD